MNVRPIRFRAKAIDTGNWVEGYYAIHHFADYDEQGEIEGFTERQVMFNDEPGNRKGGYWTYINPATLGQFTGLTDRYGNEIWEGDILDDPMLVGGGCVRVVYLTKFAAFRVYHPLHGYLPISTESMEVVGNIYDSIYILEQEYEKEDVKRILHLKDD